jgi:hypothetical protein
MQAILPEATLVSTLGRGKMHPDFMIRNVECWFDKPRKGMSCRIDKQRGKSGNGQKTTPGAWWRQRSVRHNAPRRYR